MTICIEDSKLIKDNSDEQKYNKLLKGLTVLERLTKTSNRIAKEIERERYSKNTEYHS